MMKKTIATLAIFASTNAYALIGPGPQPETENVCFKTYKMKDRSLEIGGCDQSKNNANADAKLYENGCAKGQVSAVVEKDTVGSCMAPGVVQL